MSNATRRTLKLLKTAALMVASGVVGLLRVVAVLVSGTSRQGGLLVLLVLFRQRRRRMRAAAAALRRRVPAAAVPTLPLSSTGVHA